MKKYNSILFVFILLLGWGCQDPDTFVKSNKTTISNFVATLSDGTGSFAAEGEAPYGDTIKLIIPYYYPEASSTITPVNALIVSATLANSVTVSPKLGLMDLTKPVSITVTASNGDVKNYILKAEVRKSDRATIEKFTLASGLEGTINEAEKKIYLITLDDIAIQSATDSLAPHATISPDPSIARDYSKPQTFTVTSHSGKTAIYTVEKGIPNKAVFGFTSHKVLWTKNLAELDGYSDYQQIGIAVSGEHLVIPISQEWGYSATIPYYSTKDASHQGSLDLTGLPSGFPNTIFQVANDSQGHILGTTMAWEYGSALNIWKWNSVTAVPEKFISWTPASSGITLAGAVTVGRKLSIQGDLNTNAMIYSAVGGSNIVVRWVVAGGVLESQTPEIINTGLAEWGYVAKAEGTGGLKTDDYILSGNKLKPMLFNGSTQKGEFAVGTVRDFAFASKYFEFNNAKYLSIADSDDATASGFFYIFDISTDFPDSQVLKSGAINAGTPNLNATGDIAVGPVSANGFTRTVYCLISNSAVVAYELNCMEITK